MFKNENDFIEIARVLQHSLTPLSAAEIKSHLERRAVDLASNSHSPSLAEIQTLLEAMTARRVEKWSSPNGEDKYSWVFKAQSPCSSLAALLEGITAAR